MNWIDAVSTALDCSFGLWIGAFLVALAAVMSLSVYHCQNGRARITIALSYILLCGLLFGTLMSSRGRSLPIEWAWFKVHIKESEQLSYHLDKERGAINVWMLDNGEPLDIEYRYTEAMAQMLVEAERKAEEVGRPVVLEQPFGQVGPLAALQQWWQGNQPPASAAVPMLQNLIEQQQALLETTRAHQGPGLEELAALQQQLERQAREQAGEHPAVSHALHQAATSMQQAEQMLQNGEATQAAERQQNALDALNRAMQRAMMSAMQSGNGDALLQALLQQQQALLEMAAQAQAEQSALDWLTEAQQELMQATQEATGDTSDELEWIAEQQADLAEQTEQLAAHMSPDMRAALTHAAEAMSAAQQAAQSGDQSSALASQAAALEAIAQAAQAAGPSAQQLAQLSALQQALASQLNGLAGQLPGALGSSLQQGSQSMQGAAQAMSRGQQAQALLAQIAALQALVEAGEALGQLQQGGEGASDWNQQLQLLGMPIAHPKPQDPVPPKGDTN